MERVCVQLEDVEIDYGSGWVGGGDTGEQPVPHYLCRCSYDPQTLVVVVVVSGGGSVCGLFALLSTVEGNLPLT